MQLLLFGARPLRNRHRVARDKLSAQAIEEHPRVGQILDGREGNPLETAQVEEPAGTLYREGGLPLASLAEESEDASVTQQPLDREKLARSPHESVGGRPREIPLADLPLDGEVERIYRSGCEELEVASLLLEKDGYEPVDEAQLTMPTDLPAIRVIPQVVLRRDHGAADPLPRRQALVEAPHEATRRLDQHRVGHGEDRSHPHAEEPSRNRGGHRIVGPCGLARLQHEEGHPTFAQENAQPLGIDQLHSPLEL